MTGFNASMATYQQGFAGGLVVRGLPLNVAHPGKIFFVGNANVAYPNRKASSDALNHGTFLAPYNSINYAVTQCVADRGDIIMALPGHVEDIAAATSLVLDVAGVAIVGLGTGSNTPQLNFSAAAGTVDVTGDNVSLVNLAYKADVTAVVLGIDVSANYFTMKGCEYNYNETGDDFISMLDVVSVTDAIVEGNAFYAEPIAGCNSAIRLDAATRMKIVGNTASGDFTTAVIDGANAASLDILIKGNDLYNADATAALCIGLLVACTGLINKNTVGGILAAAPESMINPGSCRANENYVCNLIDTSGILVPTAAST